MLNLSNVLSLSRAALALIFLQHHVWLRVMAIVFAMISDVLDGYIARRSGTTSQFGAILDPIMDKFFVFFAGGVLYLEGGLVGWELIMLISRDLSLCLFGTYLAITRGLKDYECKAILWGKLSTVGQFVVLIGVTCHIIFPAYVYLLFVMMAAFAFIELFAAFRSKKQQDD